jgi:periplasmic divalent cation tolerance protein
MKSIYLIYSTHPDEACARRLSNKLIELGLIACSNIFEMNSCYIWETKMENSQEWVAIYKTRKSRIKSIIAFFDKNHPYEVPCVIHWKIRANNNYAKWVKHSTKRINSVPPTETSDKL